MYGASEKISQVYQKGRLGVSRVTQPFFELQTPDFAWKFVWTVPRNFEQKIVRGVRRGVRGVHCRRLTSSENLTFAPNSDFLNK